jgi:RNA polymerase sigma factor (sigma-70 family)
MDDAQLVVAAQAGDRNALAAIYDRYADRIHDFCASILRNRAEAGSALQETFLVAFEALDRLAEPARLDPWLFAIAHRTILDRIATGSSSMNDGDDLVWGLGPGESRLSRTELAEFVWQVAGGLNVRDRVLLDLHLRQGLEGRDLASAAGSPASLVDSRLEQLEDQVDRSLGALLVARTAPRGCPVLFSLMDGWDGRLTPEFRDQVTAHVDDCEVCNSRRRIVPRPLELVGVTAMAPAPAYLRSVVLGKAELDAVGREGDFAPGRILASAGWAFTNDGFPDLSGGEPSVQDRPTGPVYASTRVRPTYSGAAAARAPTAFLPAVAPPPSGPFGRGSGPGGPGSGSGLGGPGEPGGDKGARRAMLVGGLAGLIILIAAAVIVLSSRSPGSSGTVGVGTATTVTTVVTQTSDTAPVTTNLVVVPSPTVSPTTTAPPAGHLVVAGSKTVALGTSTSTASTAALIVGNDGQAPLDITVTPTGLGLTVNPVAGTVSPGASQTLMVTLDRTAAPPGPYTGTIQITSVGGKATVNVTALIDSGPVISNEMANPSTLFGAGCKGHLAGTSSFVTATVTSTEPVQVVVLHWQSATMTAATGSKTMSSVGSTYSATLGPFAGTGTVDWWITAIDTAGATSSSTQHPLIVSC